MRVRSANLAARTRQPTHSTQSPHFLSNQFENILKASIPREKRERLNPLQDLPRLEPSSGKAFDPSQLLQLIEKSPANRETVLTLIANMIERSPRQLNASQLAWQDGKVDESARILHTLRGSLGTLGAPRFADAALTLENKLRGKQAWRIIALFDTAQKELEEAIGTAETWLVQQQSQK